MEQFNNIIKKIQSIITPTVYVIEIYFINKYLGINWAIACIIAEFSYAFLKQINERLDKCHECKSSRKCIQCGKMF